MQLHLSNACFEDALLPLSREGGLNILATCVVGGARRTIDLSGTARDLLEKVCSLYDKTMTVRPDGIILVTDNFSRDTIPVLNYPELQRTVTAWQDQTRTFSRAENNLSVQFGAIVNSLPPALSVATEWRIRIGDLNFAQKELVSRAASSFCFDEALKAWEAFTKASPHMGRSIICTRLGEVTEARKTKMRPMLLLESRTPQGEQCLSQVLAIEGTP